MSIDIAQVRDQLRISSERINWVMNAASAPSPNTSAYPEQWTVADVLSHLGSGAEIFDLLLERAHAGRPEPVQSDFIAIWDRWNAKSPEEQVRDGLQSDQRFVRNVLALPPDTDTVPAFGSHMSTADFLAMRLQEHVVHTWDVEVSTNTSATIPAVHLAFLLEQLPAVAPRSARASGSPRRVHVHVTSPDLDFLLTLGAETTLSKLSEPAPADLTFTAESFVRLVFGRLPDAGSVVRGRDESAVMADLIATFIGY